ncbi:MAG: tetratricopeptide repeat protein [Acidobacteria bacterium]|nr:tetratricopeptide repeat protein [Acidobacteriota bacterium]
MRGRTWVLAALFLAPAVMPAGQAPIVVDYPLNGSIFPPEFPPPTFAWRDTTSGATTWAIDIAFAGGAAPMHFKAPGGRWRIGPIDPRAVGPTNQPPKLTPEQAAARTWTPDAAAWSTIKKNSVGAAATLTITGYRDAAMTQAASSGKLNIATSADPVGAPIFYRDVPLMPSETEKGVVKPLASNAIPLIAWRLRDVSKPESRVLMTGIHSCANCHSVSRDGRTMGMDLDGPRNDKGLYALFPIERRAAIRDDNVIAWSTFRGKLGGKLRVGFMSQVSPEGQYVVTTINDPGPPASDYAHRKNPVDLVSNYYVANFKDYRFLQVFYPTRGVLAWYSKASGRLEPLPGADDPRYVHTNAVWSPDGKYLVFARAAARDAYPAGSRIAERANDPNETQIRYDLYRIPFNNGRGGAAEPIPGASANGMSNSFPKVSPDGKWIVFVKAANGQLMRPDSKLYIAPAEGGQARLMKCNTPLMNSWHSFSPNGRWLVFSSKSRSPYTQMFLTHIDENGDDSPAILIENSTASNRAVNIPEFVNVAPDAFEAIDAPVTDYYRMIDEAEANLEKRQFGAAVREFERAVAVNPNEAVVRNSLGLALARAGRRDDAMEQFRKAIALTPDYPEPYSNLATAFAGAGNLPAAVDNYEKALKLDATYPEAQAGLGTLYISMDRLPAAIEHLEQAVKYKGDDARSRANLALALARNWRAKDAVPHAEQAVKLSKGQDPDMLDLLGSLYAETSRFPDAAATERKLLALVEKKGDPRMIAAVRAKIALYEAGRVE